MVDRTAGEVRLAELARDVVTAIAPDELELFDQFSSGRPGGGPGSRFPGWRGGAIGSGLDPQLVSLVVYPVLTGAILQVLGVATGGRWRRPWGARSRPVDPVLTREVLDRAEAVRAACVDQALAAGVSRRRAELIADAVYAALLRVDREDRR